MKRLPVSVVLVAAPGADGARVAARTLSALRPSLGLRDEVVVVADGAPVSAGGSRDLAARRHAGVQAATHEVVALVCADAVPPAHALDALVLALTDDVAATVPVHDRGEGRQAVCPPLGALESGGALRSWSRSWREDHRGEREGVREVSDEIVVARRTDLLADGCAPGLGTRLAAQGGVVVVREVAWHHPGVPGCLRVPANRPLLSAAVIVKDEEDVLGECLSALHGVVDEIIVYDTGSSDRTVEIARAQGAHVVLGYWDDDFSAARNRCLAHCSGQFFLQVDADEVLEVADAAEFRRMLLVNDGSAFLVDVINKTESGFGTEYVMPLRRLARRDDGRYSGRLHEQFRRFDGAEIAPVLVPGISLLHSGYLAFRMADRDKSERNLRIAALAVQSTPERGVDKGTLLANLVRSQKMSGKDEDVLATAARSIGVDGTPLSRREIARTAAKAAATLRRFDEAHEWIARLEDACSGPDRAEEIRAEVLVEEGRYADAYAAVLRIPDGVRDDDGRFMSRDAVLVVEVRALLGLERPADAAARIIEVAESGTINLPLVFVQDVLRKAPGSLARYARRLPERLLLPTLAEAGTLPAVLADELVEEMWQARRRPAAVLAAASGFAHLLPVLRALEWSIRFREHRVGGTCPLVRLAQDGKRTARDRVVAAAVAVEAFADDAAMPALVQAAALVADSDADAVEAELRLLAPRVAADLLAA